MSLHHSVTGECVGVDKEIGELMAIRPGTVSKCDKHIYVIAVFRSSTFTVLIQKRNLPVLIQKRLFLRVASVGLIVPDRPI